MMIKVCVVVLAGIVACEGADKLCTDLGGVCQNDRKRCSGSYYTGKCSGSVNRRCCTKSPKVWYTSDCSNVDIVARDSWGARRAKSSKNLKTPVPDFFIHHTAGQACTSFSTCVKRIKSIQNYHMGTKGWVDVGYSFLVGEDGKIYEGRGWNKVGAHTQGYNSKSLAASFLGNFVTRTPNSVAQQAVKKLISCGVTIGKISTSYALFGHRDVGKTSCPGKALYNIIKTWPRFHAHPAK